jgi:hypothetical protein
VTKLILAAATAAVFLCSGLASVNYAKADDWTDQRGRYRAYDAPIGEKGVRWGDRCWVDTSGGGYWGYWAACTPPAKTATR